MESTLLNTCPITYWKKQHPKASACGPYSYEEFDGLIESIRSRLPKTPIITFYPQKTVEDVASFFAIWREKKAVFPLNHRLPKSVRKKRLEKIQNESPLATLIETSSTSKIVAHSLSSHVHSAQAAITALNIEEQSTVCLNLPLFHVAGIAATLRTFIAGAHLVFEDAIEKCTHLSIVPTQLYRLLKENRPLSHLKCLLLGGAPLSRMLKEQSRHLPLFHCYGMTETASMVLIQKPGHKIEILPHTEYILGEGGELFLRGPTLLDHYVGEKTRERAQWFATKDIADKNLNIIGRKDRQFREEVYSIYFF